MRLEKLMISLLGLLLYPSIVHAQITWNQPNVQSAVQAQGFAYKLYVTAPGSSTVTGAVVLASVICSAASGTPPITAQCQAPNNQAIALGATVTGAKSDLTATDTVNGSLESAHSAPFISGPVVPTNLVIR